MRELLVTIVLLSVVSSEEFEPRKRLEIPPEEDPNFWPTRGRRSYWTNPGLFSNLIRRESPESSEIDYRAGRSSSWTGGDEFLTGQGVLGFSDNWRLHLCPRKKSISLVLPLQKYNPDENEVQGCVGRCGGSARGRDRRGDERWRRQQPLYAEEPRWIAIDFDQSVLGGSAGHEDPFIVARGRKRSEYQALDVRDRRHLDDVFNSYNPDPFFVARGKRNVNYEEEKTPGKTEAANRVESKPRNRRMKKKAEDKDRKKKPNGHPRVERSSSDIFDEENDLRVHRRSPSQPKTEFQVKPRYSGPRDKHSNLQSILDEPFFISRGKKDGDVEYLRYEDRGEDGIDKQRIKIGQEVMRLKEQRAKEDAEDADRVLGEIFNLYNSNLDFWAAERVKKSKQRENKPPRNRRGMLDELLTSDDPFYVARGKKASKNDPANFLYPKLLRASMFVHTADEPVSTNGKFSLFAKTTRTKLLQKLSDLDFPKLYQPQTFETRDFTLADFSNATKNPVNHIK